MKNRVQNTVIVLLSLTAIVLFIWTAVSGVGGFFSADPIDGQPGDGLTAGPLMPVSAVINTGEHCTLLRETRLLTPYFEALRPILIELLGSAGEPVRAEQDDWIASLGEKGVLLDYGSVLPVAAIAGNAGGSLAGLEADSLLILLAEELVSVHLYADGVCHTAQTALKTADLEVRLLGSEGEAVCYAYTLGEASEPLTPHSAVPLAASASGVLTRAPFCDASGSYERERQAMILEAFGFDSYTARSYADAASGRVFLADSGSLRTGGDGSLVFVAADGTADAAGQSADIAGCVNAASAILADCAAGLTNVPRYVLSAVEADGARTVAVFDAYADGRVLVSQNGSRTAARFVFVGERLMQAEISLFSVAVTGAELSGPLLPPSVLLAGLSGSAEGGRLSPAYLEGDGGWQAAFCVMPPRRDGNGADANG